MKNIFHSLNNPVMNIFMRYNGAAIIIIVQFSSNIHPAEHEFQKG